MDTERTGTPSKHHNLTPQKTGKEYFFNNGSNFSLLYGGHKRGFHPRTPNNELTSSTSSFSYTSTCIMSPPPKRYHLQAHSQQKRRVRNPFETALVERLQMPIIASPSLFQRPTTPQLSSTQFEWTIDEVSSLQPANVEPHETQFQDSPDPEYEAKAQSAISSFFKEHQIVPSPINCPLRKQRIILSEINSNTPIAKPGRRIRDMGTQTALTLPPELPPALEMALRPYFQPDLAAGYGEDGYPSLSNRDGSGLSFQNTSNGSGAHNISMRRKLFDIHNIVVLDGNQKMQSPVTPKTNSSLSVTTLPTRLREPCPTIAGVLSDSLNKSTESLFSPISCEMNEYLSPENDKNNECGAPKSKLRRRSFIFKSPDGEELSPIFSSSKTSNRREKNMVETVNAEHKEFETPAKIANYSSYMRRRRVSVYTEDDEDANIDINGVKFTPDRSSSPLHSFQSSASASSGTSSKPVTFATESFHLRISRLAVNSAVKSTRLNGCKSVHTNYYMDATEILDTDDDDAMQTSHLSMQHSNLSSSSINSHCDTPTGKRRSVNRKNLSQSFSANWPSDEDDNGNTNGDDDNYDIDDNNERLTNKIDANIANGMHTKLSNLINDKIVCSVGITKLPNTSDDDDGDDEGEDDDNTQGKKLKELERTLSSQQQSGNFYRTDSGFNEMTTSSTSTALLLLSQQDESSRDAFKSNPEFVTCQKTINPAILCDNVCCLTPSNSQNEFKLISTESTSIDLL